MHLGPGMCYQNPTVYSYTIQLQLLQRRLLYRLPRTTRGSHPLNINHPHSDSSSHHSSYLGLTNHPHLQLIYTHTYEPHTQCYTVFDFSVLDLDPFPVILIVYCLPRPRIVSPELCLLAACPDPPPGTRHCLCLTPAVSALPVFDPVLSDYSH